MTGVAGSGKSSLVHGSIPDGAGVVSIDQTAIHGSRRSNPATYTGLLDPIRTAFAKANDVKPALFSSNSEGACPTCNGNGMIYTELGFMETVATPCEDCGGKRFQASVLELRFGRLNIAEVLDLPVAEAHAFFAEGDAKTPAAASILARLEDVGLGYLKLGQPLPTLSGGERQRLKLATRMAEKGGDLRPRRADLAASTSPTSSSCSACSTGSSTRASRSSSSRTTRRSWRTPTGSSTSVPAPATTAAGSSSRARRPTSSPPAPPSPASTSRRTSAPDRGLRPMCGTIRTMTAAPPCQHLRDLAWLRRVRDRIDRDYAQPLDVEALARGAHMSAGHLSREFRLAYGESPYGYLMTRRIERAMALLRRGDLSVTEVCFEVGCSSLGTFSTRFTELVGVPPSVYRRHEARATEGMPSCVAKQVTRPIRNREAPATEPQPA